MNRKNFTSVTCLTIYPNENEGKINYCEFTLDYNDENALDEKYEDETVQKLMYEIYTKYKDFFHHSRYRGPYFYLGCHNGPNDHNTYLKRLFKTVFSNRYYKNENLRKLLLLDHVEKHTLESYNIKRELYYVIDEPFITYSNFHRELVKDRYKKNVIKHCPIYTLVKYNKQGFKLPTELLMMLKGFLYHR